MKKISFLIVSIFASLLLVACGEESTEDKNISNESQTQPEENPNQDYRKNVAATFEEAVAHYSEDILSADPKSTEFIKSNYQYFPALSEDEIQKVKETSQPIDYKQLVKNPAPFNENILSFTGEVVQVFEENIAENIVLSELFIYSEEYDNSFTVFMYKDTGDIVEGDFVKVYGLVTGVYSVEVSTGGFLNSPLFIGSHVEKQ